MADVEHRFCMPLQMSGLALISQIVARNQVGIGGCPVNGRTTGVVRAIRPAGARWLKSACRSSARLSRAVPLQCRLRALQRALDRVNWMTEANGVSITLCWQTGCGGWTSHEVLRSIGTTAGCWLRSDKSAAIHTPEPSGSRSRRGRTHALWVPQRHGVSVRWCVLTPAPSLLRARWRGALLRRNR